MSIFGFGKKKAKIAKVAAAGLVAASAPAAQHAPDPPRAASVKAQAGATLARHQSGEDALCAIYATERRLGSSPQQAMHAVVKHLDTSAHLVVRKRRDLRTYRRVLWEVAS